MSQYFRIGSDKHLSSDINNLRKALRNAKSKEVHFKKMAKLSSIRWYWNII